MATSHIYLLISITICIICILPLMWLPVYKAEPDDAAAAEVMYYQRLAAERTIQAKYDYAAWCMRPVRKSILLPAASCCRQRLSHHAGLTNQTGMTTSRHSTYSTCQRTTTPWCGTKTRTTGNNPVTNQGATS